MIVIGQRGDGSLVSHQNGFDIHLLSYRFGQLHLYITFKSYLFSGNIINDVPIICFLYQLCNPCSYCEADKCQPDC